MGFFVFRGYSIEVSIFVFQTTESGSLPDTRLYKERYINLDGKRCHVRIYLCADNKEICIFEKSFYIEIEAQQYFDNIEKNLIEQEMKPTRMSKSHIMIQGVSDITYSLSGFNSIRITAWDDVRWDEEIKRFKIGG